MDFASLGYENAELLGLDVPAFSGDSMAIGDDLADLLSGDDDGYAEVGRKLARAAARNPAAVGKALARTAQQMQAVREIDPGAVIVRSQQDKRRRRLSLGLPVTTLAAGAIAEIEIKPQRVFRAEDFLVPDDVANACEIITASVGQNSQLVGGSPVPLAGFSTLCYRPSQLLWDTANPGILVTLQIRNFSSASVVLRGELRGTTTVR